MSTTFKVIIAIVVTAAVIGGGAYWYMQNQIGKIRDDNTKQVEDLNSKIKDLKSSSVSRIETSDTSDTPAAATDETASWKSYASSNYKYSVKYPGDYSEISSTGTSGPDLGYIVDFKAVGSMTIRIQATPTNETNLTNLLKTNIALNVTDRNNFIASTVNGQSANKYINYLAASSKQKTGALVLTLKNGHYYEISTGSQYTTFTAADELLFDRFVSTFQFTK